MLNVALRTLRVRWVTFLGSFVALSLGVALISVMGLALSSAGDAPVRKPERFAAAPVVVKAADVLRVPTPIGDRTQRLAQPRALPTALVAKLRDLGAVAEDRSFAVRARGGPGDLVGHPWSVAAFTPYEIVTGRAPRAADEVVVSGGWAAPGRSVRTAQGTVRVVGRVRVADTARAAGTAPAAGTVRPTTARTATARTAGTVAGHGFEDAVFFTDRRAAQLSPGCRQLVVDADAAAVRRAVRDSGARVLTGNARRYADPDPDRDSEALTAMNAMFGTAGGVASFVSVFVVASTFAFAVSQRRREFALLRTAGATPGQVRRMVLAEAVGVGVLASATGCVIGACAAPVLAARVVAVGLAPGWFSIGHHVWPYHAAFWTGLAVALCGAAAASWRAGRTDPVRALRESSVDARSMTGFRRLCGAVLLLTAAVTLALTLVTDPGELLHRKSYVSRPMLLITAVALLAPAVVRPTTRLLTWLPARLPGAGGMLVRENATAHLRRTAAIATPVLVMVALTGSLLGATATLDEARTTEVRARTAADFVVTAAPGTGFDPATLHRLRAVPGATVSATSSSAVYVLEDGVALVRSEARGADPRALTATTRLPVAAGRVSDLDDDSIVVTEEWQRHTVGQRVRVWLGDGTRRTLRIAAVMATGTGDNGVYVTPRNTPGAVVDRADVTVAEGADADTVAAALRAAVPATEGQVLTKDQWVRASWPRNDGTTRTGLFLVLGIALLYTGITLVSTMLMATSDRVRDLAALRLAGATRRQVLRLVGAEALMVVGVGSALGLLVTVLNLLGLWSALGLLSVWTTIGVPWTALGAAVGACAVLAVISSVARAALVLRHRAIELAGARE